MSHTETTCLFQQSHAASEYAAMTGSRAVIIVAGILLLLQLIATTRSLIYTALHDSVATVILNF